MIVVWDPKKAKANLVKHGVTFEEAETVLDSDQQLIIEDKNYDEDRFIALGYSKSLNLLVVVYCYRFEDVIRIISARKATKKRGKLMKKEYDFSKAKVHKGPIKSSTKNSKIQKTFRLDEDVFEWLVAEGKRKGIPYQTMMNSLLKQLMNQEESLAERVSKLEAKLNMKKSG